MVTRLDAMDHGVELSSRAGLPWVPLRPCLVPEKFCKIFQISRHIESLDICMEY